MNCLSSEDTYRVVQNKGNIKDNNAVDDSYTIRYSNPRVEKLEDHEIHPLQLMTCNKCKTVARSTTCAGCCKSEVSSESNTNDLRSRKTRNDQFAVDSINIQPLGERIDRGRLLCKVEGCKQEARCKNIGMCRLHRHVLIKVHDKLIAVHDKLIVHEKHVAPTELSHQNTEEPSSRIEIEQRQTMSEQDMDYSKADKYTKSSSKFPPSMNASSISNQEVEASTYTINVSPGMKLGLLLDITSLVVLEVPPSSAFKGRVKAGDRIAAINGKQIFSLCEVLDTNKMRKIKFVEKVPGDSNGSPQQLVLRNNVTKTDGLERSMKRMGKKMEEHKAEFEEHKELTEQVNISHFSEIHGVKFSIGYQEGRLRSAEAEVHQLKSEVKSKNTQLDQLQSEVTELKSEVKYKNSQLDQLQSEVTEVKSEVKYKNSQLDRLQSEVNELKTDSQSKNTQVDQLLFKYNKLEGQIASLTSPANNTVEGSPSREKAVVVIDDTDPQSSHHTEHVPIKRKRKAPEVMSLSKRRSCRRVHTCAICSHGFDGNEMWVLRYKGPVKPYNLPEYPLSLRKHLICKGCCDIPKEDVHPWHVIRYPDGTRRCILSKDEFCEHESLGVRDYEKYVYVLASSYDYTKRILERNTW